MLNLCVCIYIYIIFFFSNFSQSMVPSLTRTMQFVLLANHKWVSLSLLWLPQLITVNGSMMFSWVLGVRIPVITSQVIYITICVVLVLASSKIVRSLGRGKKFLQLFSQQLESPDSHLSYSLETMYHLHRSEERRVGKECW